MRHRTLPASTLFLFVAACSSTALLDEQDDMSSGGVAPETGQVGVICDTCLESTCQWQVTECAAEPSCARWYTCAVQCPAVEGQAPWDTSCISSCEEPDTTTGKRLRDDLLTCVRNAETCCGVTELRDPTTEPDAGYGGSAGGNQLPGGGGNANDYAAGACGGDTCQACLFAIKANTEGCLESADAACSQTISDCYHENGYPENGAVNACWLVVTRRDCNRPGTDIQLPDECGYAVTGDSLDRALATLQCATKYCEACVPGGDQECFACQLASCPDEVQAWMGNVDAQRLTWCLEGCANAADPTSCKKACRDANQAGQLVLQSLLSCKQTACEASCS